MLSLRTNVALRQLVIVLAVLIGALKIAVPFMERRELRHHPINGGRSGDGPTNGQLTATGENLGDHPKGFAARCPGFPTLRHDHPKCAQLIAKG